MINMYLYSQLKKFIILYNSLYFIFRMAFEVQQELVSRFGYSLLLLDIFIGSSLSGSLILVGVG